MNDYVTYRAFEPLIRLARAHGLAEDLLTRDLGRSHETLLNERGFVTWNEFARYCDRLEEAMGGCGAMGDVGAILKDVPSYVALLRLGGLVTTPKWFFQVLTRWFGPSMIPAVRYDGYENVDDRTLRICLHSPAGQADCAAFFRITASFFRYGPTLVGIPPAVVHLELQPRCGTFTIELPPSVSMFARIKRAAQSAWSGHAMVDELARQHEVLVSNYDKLQRSEASFRILIENSPDGAVVFTPEKILYANNAMSDFLGVSDPGELVGKSITDLCRDPEALAMWLRGDDVSSLHSREVAFRRDGENLVWAEVNTIAVQFQGVSAYLSMIRDMTMRHQVFGRAVEMDRMISMGILAAGVGHEIKNPLAYLKANIDYSRMTIEELATRLDAQALPESEKSYFSAELEEIERALAASVDGAERLLTIAQDLNTFSRAADAKLEAVMLDEVIQTSINVARHEIGHRAQLDLDLCCQTPVRANATQLTQVILNLLINAAQAIARGKVSENRICIRTGCEGDTAFIEIEDTGSGISSRDLESIFDPFFTTKPPGEGTGLGLPISRNIILGFDGDLTFTSEVGVGTTARITLPLYDSDEGL